MALRDILILPEPVLRKVAEPVADIDDRVRALGRDMLETMYAAPGIGLAAPQIGVRERIIVCDCAGDGEPPQPLVLVNPTIVARSDDGAVLREGCLSIPEVYEEVERPAEVRVSFLDMNGELRERDAEGLLARCLQHEIDHLNGILFIDYLSRLKRDRIVKKFQKQARLAGDGPIRPAASA